MTQQIWQNRLRREFDGLDKSLEEIQGGDVRLIRYAFDVSKGSCRATFSFNIPVDSFEDDDVTSSDTSLKPLDSHASLEFTLEFDLDLHTRYPFDPPRIRVLDGSSVLPPGTVSNQVLILPDAEGWTPSNTVLGTIQSLIYHISKEYHKLGSVATLPADSEVEMFAVGQAVHVDQLRGSLFPCRRTSEGSILSIRGSSPGIYLAVKGLQVLELVAHETTLNIAVVKRTYKITDLAKLRYSRGKSVTLVLKGSGGTVEDGDEVEYLMNQSYQCMQTITRALQQLGIPRHQSSTTAERKVDAAKEVLERIDQEQMRLSDNPTVDAVRNIMDLFRQAAELFGTVDDDRAQEVVSKMHCFLQRSDIIFILDNEILQDKRSIKADDDADISVQIESSPASNIDVSTNDIKAEDENPLESDGHEHNIEGVEMKVMTPSEPSIPALDEKPIIGIS